MQPLARARIKVAHIVTRLDLGGAQQNTLHTVKNLDPRRFEALLVCGPGGSLDADVKSWPAGEPRRFVVADLVRPVSPRQDLRAFLALRRILRAERPLVAHTHSSKAGILGRLAAWSAGVRVIVHTYHGFGFHDRQPWWLKSLYVAAERLCCAVSDALIFVSRSNWDYARRHHLGKASRYALIRSGISLSDFPSRGCDAGRKKESLGLPAQARLVLSVGNLKPQKNPLDFLAAARMVSASRKDAAFVFVGDGPLRERLSGEADAAGLKERFLLPGWRRDVPELLAAADVFVMTSLWEGLPRALVEAMKSGVAPVCYATDGVTDLIRDGVNGFAVKQGDVPALARRVLELLGDESLRRKMGEAAASGIDESFDIDRMVRQQEELYLLLLNRQPAGQAHEQTP
ncbi:MAG TPA: hypothetical protein DEB40_08420 [Elusimicrobia bacterium]|nr:hypothetical protein [Elusimicrobiota bacterium]HBT61753.1 hypothetical protein [Elusimicrobiota bacterium]